MEEQSMDMAVEERREREHGGETAEVAVEAVGVAGEELAAVRAALLRAYPETVAELVGGESVAALLASVEPAAEAYRRVAAAVGARAGAGSPAAARPPAVGRSVAAADAEGRAAAGPYVPAGNVAPVAVDVAGLPATEKIRRGLAGRR